MARFIKLLVVGLAASSTAAFAASPATFTAACCALGACCGLPCCG